MHVLEKTSKQYFKELRVLHTALLIGQVAIAATLYYIVHGEKLTWGFEAGDVYSYIVLGVMIFGLLASSFIYKKLLGKAKRMTHLEDKLGAYWGASIAKWALLEGPALIGIILFYLTSNLTFLLMAGVMIAYLATTGTSIEKAIEDLSLNREEQGRIRRPDEIVARITSNR